MTQPSAASQPALRFGALRHRDYLTYYLTGSLAMMADNIEHVISYWVIFKKFHSPTLAGFAVISHWLPFIFFSLYAGALADRFDCRKLIQASQAMYMVASLAWGVLFLTDTLEVWHAVVILALHGMAGVLSLPASQLIIYDVVGPEHLQSAVRLNASSRQLSLLLGPAVGGVLMLLLGPSGGLLANVLIYVPMSILMLVFPYTGHRQAVQARRVSGIGLSEARQILGEVRKDPRMFTMVVLGGITALLIGNGYQPQMPEYAHHFGADDAGVRYSALLTANAVGAFSGTLLLESTNLLRPNTRTAIICAALWSVTMGLFAVAPSYEIGLVLLLLAGFLLIAFTAMAQTIVQLHAPQEIRGRVLGLYNMANLGLRSGSGLSVGMFGSLVGIHWSLGLSAGALFLITLGLLVFERPAAQS